MLRPNYDIQTSPHASRDLRRIPIRDRRPIGRGISSLAQSPRRPGIKKIKWTDDLYRLRVGDWRVRITNVERKEKDTYR